MTTPFPGLGCTDTSIQSGKVKLVLLAQTSPLSEIMRSCNCIPQMSKMSPFTYKCVNSVVKNLERGT